jgi:hypothetical protein
MNTADFEIFIVDLHLLIVFSADSFVGINYQVDLIYVHCKQEYLHLNQSTLSLSTILHSSMAHSHRDH